MISIKKAFIYKIFTKMPVLETERLRLRRMLVTDSTDMFEYSSDPKVTKYLTWYPHPDADYTHDYLEYIGTKYRTGDFYDWAITLRSNGKMIGTCGFTRFNFTDDSAEVGYVLNPAYWGQGIAPEALSAVLKFGFDKLSLNRMEAKYIDGNDASRRVMEKVGMKYEGTLRSSMLIKGEYKNIGICSILRSEYYS